MVSFFMVISRSYDIKRQLHPKEELLIDKNGEIALLVAFLSSKHSIPTEEVSVAKPRAFQLKDVSYVPLLSWKIDPNSVISQAPLKLTDG